MAKCGGMALKGVRCYTSDVRFFWELAAQRVGDRAAALNMDCEFFERIQKFLTGITQVNR